jgi:uncharacterized spore protein YtfJ
MSDLLDRIAQHIHLNASASQVYGDPIERDGTTLIPVAKVQWGFGAGTLGRPSAERGGGGGGARANPAGYILLRDGKAEYRPIHDPAVTAAAAAVAGVVAGFVFAKLSG